MSYLPVSDPRSTIHDLWPRTYTRTCMSKRLIECVPNFSEGRDEVIIEAIASEIRSVMVGTLFKVEPGKATTRKVYTLVGVLEPVFEAAFRAAKKGIQVIDMSRH